MKTLIVANAPAAQLAAALRVVADKLDAGIPSGIIRDSDNADIGHFIKGAENEGRSSSGE